MDENLDLWDEISRVKAPVLWGERVETGRSRKEIPLLFSYKQSLFLSLSDPGCGVPLGCVQGIPSFQVLAQRDGRRTPLTVTAQLPYSSEFSMGSSWLVCLLGIHVFSFLVLPWLLLDFLGKKSLSFQFSYILSYLNLPPLYFLWHLGSSRLLPGCLLTSALLLLEQLACFCWDDYCKVWYRGRSIVEWIID